MSWIFISVVGYFFNAASALTGKFLLEKLVSHPAVYAFWVSVFGLVALVFAPFGFSIPGLPVILASAVAGILYTFALVLLYFALQKSEASRIFTLVGGISPVFVLVAASLALGERLSMLQIGGFFVILAGGYVISEKFGKPGLFLNKQVIIASVASALFFALSNVLTKWIYLQEVFLNGFVWRSLGALVGCVVLLLIPLYRREILGSFKHPKLKTETIFIFGQIFAVLGFILINYGFSLGSVSLVNALSGTQYVFLFFMAWPISKKYPRIFEESLTPGIIRQKVASLVLIAVGIFMLFA